MSTSSASLTWPQTSAAGEDTAESGDPAQARQAASAIGRILDDAHAAVALQAR